MTKKKRTVNSSLINLFGAGFPILITLITLPILLPLIGEKRYGLLMIFWAFIGYFGLFDLGLGRALANQVAKNVSDKTILNKLFSTSLILSLILGILGGGVLFVIAESSFKLVIDSNDSLQQEVQNSIYLLFLAMPLVVVSSIFSGFLEGLQRFLEMNIALLVGSTLMQILPVFIALHYSSSLFDIILAVLIGRIISLLLFTYFVMKIIPLNISYDKNQVSNLIHFGAWVSVSSVLQPILMLTDRFILASKFGAATVTYYVVPYNLASKLSIVPNSLASVLFPRFSMENDNSNQLMITSRIALVAIMTPLVIVAMIVATYFFPFWLGDVGNHMVLIAQILLVGFWFNAISYVPYAYIQGIGKPSLTAKIHLYEVLPYLVLLWFLINTYGIHGAAISLVSRLVVDSVLLFYFAGGKWPDLKYFLISVLLVMSVFFVINLTIESMVVYVTLLVGLLSLSMLLTITIFRVELPSVLSRKLN